jgi:hypothetical protein
VVREKGQNLYGQRPGRIASGGRLPNLLTEGLKGFKVPLGHIVLASLEDEARVPQTQPLAHLLAEGLLSFEAKDLGMMPPWKLVGRSRNGSAELIRTG